MERTFYAAQLEHCHGCRVSAWSSLEHVYPCLLSHTTLRSFLAGALPLSFALSPRQLRLVTAIGTGVLVGTSLIVIIPEGVETLYSAREIGNARSVPIPKSVSSPAWRPPISEDETRRVRRDYADVIEVRQVVAEPDDEEPEYPGLPYEPVVPEEPESQMVPKKKQKSEKETWEPHAWIGISVILGFILMYLIDHVPRHATSDYQPKPSHISLNSFNLRRSDAQEGDEQNGNAGDAFTPPEEEAHSTRPSSTTVGLVIHAAADGIALGASASGSSTRLGFIVFLALMVHKAPAAFGLTSALLKQGLSKRRVRTHLVIFSLAAPVGALTTWVITNLFGGGLSGSEEGTQFATGVLLLFSGGTFL